jgi:general secretion pathway protein G
MKNTKGFTLIELLVVITIIGILATGAVTLFSNSAQKARDAVRQNDMTNLESANNLKFADSGTVTECSGGAATTCAKDDLTLALQGTFINKVPSDPTNAAPSLYAYVIDAAGTAATRFEFSAALEASANDAAEDNDQGNNTDTFEVGSGVAALGATSGNAAITASSTTANF